MGILCVWERQRYEVAMRFTSRPNSIPTLHRFLQNIALCYVISCRLKAFSRRRFYGRQMFTESCQPSLRLLIRWPSVSFTNPPSLSLKELSNLLFTPIPRSPLLAKKHHDRHKDGGTSARQGDNHLTLSFPGRQISLQSTWQSDAPFRDKTCSPASFIPSFMSSSRNLQFCLFPNVQRSLQPWLRLWEYFKTNTKTPTNSRSVSKKKIKKDINQ